MVDDLITSVLLRSISAPWGLSFSPCRPWRVMNLQAGLLHTEDDGLAIMETFSSQKWLGFLRIP